MESFLEFIGFLFLGLFVAFLGIIFTYIIIFFIVFGGKK